MERMKYLPIFLLMFGCTKQTDSRKNSDRDYVMRCEEVAFGLGTTATVRMQRCQNGEVTCYVTLTYTETIIEKGVGSTRLKSDNSISCVSNFY